MAFQFSCPQGHLLETEESYVGQPCQCPHCGTTFAIPSPPSPAAPPPFPGISPTPGSHIGPAPAPFVTEKAEPEVLHIPCPNGHELETPRDMLGQDALCPHCRVQFRLREKDSVEYRRRREQELERQERKAGKMWLNYAIVAAVLVTIGILGLIVISVSGG